MKLIFILVAIFFVLKILTKYLAPLLLRYASNKLAKKFNDQFQAKNDFQNSENHQTTKRSKKQTNKKTVGEYIDYEEID